MKKYPYLVVLLLFIYSCQQQDCTNGIQDGNEIGIDCGGDCPTCSTSSCNDGIKNQDEVDVDCGGVCPACDIIYAQNGTHGLNLLSGTEDTLYVNVGDYSLRAEVPEGSSLKLELVRISGSAWGISVSSVGWSISQYANDKQTFEILSPGVADVMITNWSNFGFIIKYFENGVLQTRKKIIIWV